MYNSIKELINGCEKYFNDTNFKGWNEKYKKALKNIAHDEPWLTFVAMYSLFGKQDNLNGIGLTAFKNLLEQQNVNPNINKIIEIKLEKILPEISDYKTMLKSLYSKENFHLYPDVRNKIKEEKIETNASIEGNTNLDLFIEANNDKNEKLIFFIEAKFLSDIDTKTTYNFSRDQIIRNIDAGIDYCQTEDVKIENFYFMLLTPKIFRTKAFGGNIASTANQFNPDRSRLYCYKMEEYKNPDCIKALLPHRKLSNKDWSSISENISWLTFDDIFETAITFKTFENNKEIITGFFKERNLY